MAVSINNYIVQVIGLDKELNSLLIDYLKNIQFSVNKDIFEEPTYILNSTNEQESKLKICLISDPWIADVEPWTAYYKEQIDQQKGQTNCVFLSVYDLKNNPSETVNALERKTGFKALNDDLFTFLVQTSFFNQAHDLKKVLEHKENKEFKSVLLQLRKLQLTDYKFDAVDIESKLSIVIPVYNDGEYLVEALASIERAYVDRSAIIIVNDGSSALKTLTILDELEELGYTIIHKENAGLSEARNTGIKQAKTEYVLLLDADNRVEPRYYFNACYVLDNNSEVGVVYAKPRVFGVTNHYRQGIEFDIARLLAGNYIDACAVIRKQVWEDVGGYDPNMPDQLGYEDWDFWIASYSKGWRFYLLDSYLFDYRVKQDSMAEKCNIPANRERLVEYVVSKHKDVYTKYAPAVLSSMHLNLLGTQGVAQERRKIIVNQTRHIQNIDAEKNKLLKNIDELTHVRNEQGVILNQLQEDKKELKGTISSKIDDKHNERIITETLKKEKKRFYSKISEVEQNLAKHEQLLAEELKQAIEPSRKQSQAIARNLIEIREEIASTLYSNKELLLEKVKLSADLDQHRSLIDTVQLQKNNLLELFEVKTRDTDAINHALNIANNKAEYNEKRIGELTLRSEELKEKLFWIENSLSAKIKRVIKRVFRFFFTSETNRNIFSTVILKVLFLASPIGFKVLKRVLKKLFYKVYLLLEDREVTVVYGKIQVADQNMVQEGENLLDPNVRYRRWVSQNLPRKADVDMFREIATSFSYQPKISIILPAYNPPIVFFRQAIESVLDQVYTNWELCISDDNSTDPLVKKVIKEYAAKDKRIKYVIRKKNGHISANSNSAIELATGEFCSLLDHDDLLTPDALYQVVLQLNKNKELDFIYSDEDKIDEQGQLLNPYFKPDWSPDYILSINYSTHLSTYRRIILNKIGGFRIGFEGSQDHDLVLRFVDEITEDRIYHIPRILYHWRMHDQSTASSGGVKTYAYEASVKAIKEALVRRGESGKVEILPGYIGYNVQYDIKEEKKVSIIIPTYNKTDILKVCVDSIISKTSYSNYEIVVVDNNSNEQEFFDFVKEYESKYPDIFKCYSHKIPFNFSALMNFGTSKATGDYLLFMNNDMEVISEGWLEKMVGQVQREKVGVVGAKLLFHDDTIQHAGVLIGLGGIAGHTYVKYPKSYDGHFNNANLTRNYSAVTGACLMCRREVLEEAGMWDEQFEVEFNDIDLCLRIKEKGYHGVSMADVVIYHYESLSRGNPLQTTASRERHLREVKRFVGNWKKYIENDPCYNKNLTLKNCNFEVSVLKEEREDIIHIYDELFQ
ncbi:MAG: glycosyltransferase [Cyclobacteriaceae bacterium]